MRKPLVTLAAFALVAILSASVLANEPVNPAEGAVRRIYNVMAKGDGKTHQTNFRDLARAIKTGNLTAYSTSADTSDKFKTNSDSGYHPDFGMWTGFLKRKNSGIYTIVFDTTGGNKLPMYSLWVNGVQVIDAETETTAVDVSLYAGFNEVCLVVEGTAKYHVAISIKKKDSLKEPTNLGPEDLWHEDEPDDEDDED